MSKQKKVSIYPITLRIAKPLHDRLRRISTEQSIKSGKRVTITSLILTAVERSLN